MHNKLADNSILEHEFFIRFEFIESVRLVVDRYDRIVHSQT